LRRVSIAIMALGLLVWARPGGATTVAVVRPTNASADETELVSRLRGELLSVGLAVAMVDSPDKRGLVGGDLFAWLEQLMSGIGASAAIDLVGDDAPVAVDVWTVKSKPRRIEVTRVAIEPDVANPSERLALRALEALRGNLLENDFAARERTDAAVVRAPAAPGAQSLQPGPPGRFGVEAGALALMSLDGVGPAVLPTLRLGWAARSWLWLDATVAGLGSQPTVATASGNVRVEQQFGVLGGSFRLRAGKRLWPFFELAAGVLRTSVRGQANPGTRGHTVDRWSLLLDGGFGAGLGLGGAYYAALAAHVQLADPYVAIHSPDSVAGTTGHPNLMFTLTLGAWL
jgi:hypothetical protein